MEVEDDSYQHDSSDDADEPAGAPIYEVPQRKIVAIEHPCVLLNLDKGLATFGQDPDFHKLLADTSEPSSVPLWFRPDNPTSKPIVSHHTATNNILLKITVPKRTDRKRKRGSNDPFTGDVDITDRTSVSSEADQVSSVSRHDTPKSILRKMQDNADNYQVEAVGNVQDTHRYRGLADFQFANAHGSFLAKAADHLLPMKVSKLRDLKLASGVATEPGQEIIPPPHFTDKVVGFSYNYEQNPNTKIEEHMTGARQLINIQGRKKHSYGYFINNSKYPVPQKPRREPETQMPEELMSQLHELMEERPIWTRRAILNRVTGRYSDTVLRISLQIVGYQFRGGPWRDAFVKYGVDPRRDPKFRDYQTLAFKLERNIVGTNKTSWQAVRKSQMKKQAKENRDSHFWDGKRYSTDGKFWQVCDITDPFVRKLLNQAPMRKTCDPDDSGWFYSGTWAKVKIAMKVKMIAIKRGRMGSDDDNPQKPGFLYNSFLEEKLRQWPDKGDKPLGLTLEPLLRPIEEVDTRMRKRRAPTKKFESVTADAPSSQGGEAPDNLESESIPGNDDDVPGDDEEAALEENDWEVDMLDCNLDDVDIEVDEDDDGEGDEDGDEDGDGDGDGGMEDYDGFSDIDEDIEEYGEGEEDEAEQEQGEEEEEDADADATMGDNLTYDDE
ncbi:RNA polymerase III transcription factor IIIC subunit-domain-containing protein [Hypoxylon trugodes]|uniref:RNA polymerase III transcription factor IIIC subunit-domain-containing protein n=1 Tax=Hypoxylon trugodes TaxID=326681 RepID=UPI00218E14CF|nr:RNA polymerase III transcription factor IIIC subunit-domain-containing protein [Hypoxylon trugodes]KAI1391362.1 RNA polymerase III transcription factor IIIC subunit-domain-containing protein [Hypoxylon trugodes]